MPSRTTFELAQFNRDVENARRIFDELPTTYQKRVIRPTMLAIAREIRNTARKSTAFTDRSGRLRKSIRAKAYKSSSRLPVAAYVEAGGEGARQAHLVEAGHRGPRPAPPHPFLEPAVQAAQQRAGQIIRTIFERQTLKVAAALRRRFPTGKQR